MFVVYLIEEPFPWAGCVLRCGVSSDESNGRNFPLRRLCFVTFPDAQTSFVPFAVVSRVKAEESNGRKYRSFLSSAPGPLTYALMC